MLIQLGRWLRTAGYDTAIERGSRSDAELVRHAIEENRLLITCDRGLAEHKAAQGRTVILTTSSLEDRIAELCSKVPVDWMHAPFSRCIECNLELVPAPDREASRLPDEVRRFAPNIHFCSECRNLYWEGSHVRRMKKRLARWNQPEADKAG